MECRRRAKKVEDFALKPKAKELFIAQPYISCTRTDSNDEFLKRSRIQEFEKTKVSTNEEQQEIAMVTEERDATETLRREKRLQL
ncbi:hypothetical protein Tco_1547579 [Tanacetum coccineum]